MQAADHLINALVTTGELLFQRSQHGSNYTADSFREADL
jgi:hypothetical protein